MPTQVVSIPCLDGSVRSLELKNMRQGGPEDFPPGSWAFFNGQVWVMIGDRPGCNCWSPQRGFDTLDWGQAPNVWADYPFNIWTGEPE